ncbi:hypothetical protein DES49_0356 [Halospina denitrificans]|uniref:Uncharacterized protein n=1 Tax=Halospina denitrificans TaxID=332522 RepID=A0A4R7K1D2_9GAMM|nr:hypothetical protein [Halospina denitrificans]TDT44256.1 hypothetical protein DES49_0356 [Halospina denitrificans]
MPEIRFSRRQTTINELIGDDPRTVDMFCHVNGIGKHDRIRPGRVYSLDVHDPQTKSIVAHLNSLPQDKRNTLARGAGDMGEDLHALSAFAEENLSSDKLQLINNFVDAGSGIAAARLNNFQKVVAEYQRALLELREGAKTAHGPGRGARIHKMKQNARLAFQKLESQYQLELSRFAPEALRAKNRGNALSNAERGITLASRDASSGKVDPRIKVADVTQASRMASISKVLNNLGRAAVTLDGGARIYGVTQTREEGGDWLRESSVQMTGFGLAGAGAGIAGKAVFVGGSAIAASAGLMMAGPVGWAALGVVFCVSAAVGLGVGYYLDQLGQDFASWLWEL